MDIDARPEAEGPPAPLGSVEPHAAMLSVPPDGQLLYKIISVENLLRSTLGGYLHFNRVDRYPDLPGADAHDGQQLPLDQPGNATARFAKAPNFSAANYYDQARGRTYACCFSLENSDYIWDNYANGSAKGKACVVFNFGNLRSRLNKTLEAGNASLEYNGMRCRQIFSLNYGTVEYVDWDEHRANAEHLPNPIKYTYLKGKAFCEEKELRISLSAPGMGHFRLNDKSFVEFSPSLQVPFDFRVAIANGTIAQILCAPNANGDFLKSELYKLRIVSK